MANAAGPKKFAAELKKRKVSRAQAARALNVSAPCVTQIITRQRRPSLDLAARIQNTYGVPATDFAESA